MAEQKKPAKRPARKKPTSAVDFTVWAVDGTTIPESAVQEFEDAIQGVKIKLFNDGVRVLSQTTRG